jgi:hypothetical protein
MERYYDNLDRKSKGETNSNSKGSEPNRSDASNQNASKDETELPERSKQPKKEEESLDKIQKLFSARSEDSSLAGTEHHGTVSDIFGLGENKPSPEWTKAQKGRMDEFKQMIGFSPSPGSSGGTFGSDPFAPAKSLGDALPKTANPFGGLDTSFGSRSSSPDPAWGKINPVSAPAGWADFNSKGFGSPSFSPQPARSDPVNLAPPMQNFNAPKRPF